MSTRHKERWLEALDLASRADNHQRWRDATSRVYYAVYHITCTFVMVRADDINSNHARVLSELRKAGHGRAANRYSSLLQLRTAADYKEHARFTRMNLDTALQHARAIFGFLGIDMKDEMPAAEESEETHSAELRLVREPR